MNRKQMKKFYKDVEKSVIRRFAGTTRKHYFRDLFKLKKGVVHKHDCRDEVIKRLSKKKQYKAFIRYLLVEIQESEEENERLWEYIKELEEEFDFRSYEYEDGTLIPVTS